MSDAYQIRVNDVFGPTIQGEGPFMGRTVNFIRLGLCNLHCDNCDTAQTWDASRFDLKKENPWTPVDDVIKQTQETSQSTIIVISGGEPLIHQDTAAFKYLLRGLVERYYDVHIETNGTRLVRPAVADLVTHFSVSPKLTNALVSSRDPYDKRIKMGVLRQFSNYAFQDKACFKFVCNNADHVEDVSELMSSLDVDKDKVWIMPAGEEAGVLDYTTKKVLPAVLKYGFNFSPRLHILTGVK